MSKLGRLLERDKITKEDVISTIMPVSARFLHPFRIGTFLALFQRNRTEVLVVVGLVLTTRSGSHGRIQEDV
jgi:hypothetical protein